MSTIGHGALQLDTSELPSNTSGLSRFNNEGKPSWSHTRRTDANLVDSGIGTASKFGGMEGSRDSWDARASRRNVISGPASESAGEIPDRYRSAPPDAAALASIATLVMRPNRSTTRGSALEL